jgi:hypothetical protein
MGQAVGITRQDLTAAALRQQAGRCRESECQTAPNIFHQTASKTFQFTRSFSAVFFFA